MESTIAAAGLSGHGRSPRTGWTDVSPGRSTPGGAAALRGRARRRAPPAGARSLRRSEAGKAGRCGSSSAGPCCSRRPFRRRERGFDLDRDAVVVAPTDHEPRWDLQGRHLRREGPGPPGCHLLDHQALAARDRARARAANGRDATRDQPRWPCFDVRDPLEHRLGERSIVVSTVTSIAIRERPPAGGGTSARVRAARRACRSAGSARGRHAHDRRRRGVRRSP